MLFRSLIVAAVVTMIVRATKGAELEDRTHPDDYEVEAGDPGVEELPATPEEEAVPARS